MIDRKSKIRILQITLFILSIVIIFSTYFKKGDDPNKKIISSSEIKDLKKTEETDRGDVFYNIKYAGIDISGNRYVLKSKEARTSPISQEIVNMKEVDAIFYFKDDTKLYIKSDKGTYNNESLDIIFEENTEANYEGSELFGDKILYFNSKRELIVSENVKVKSERGTIFADELLFDIEKKTLDISSDLNKVNANINLK